MLLICLFPARSFADMPKIEAGEQYFDVFKGYFVLRDKVRVEINNHGHSAIITADEAKVNVPSQKCWAEGNVNLVHNNETFSCNSAYLQWKTKTAEVVGNVKFKSKKVMSVTAEKAVFNWGDKIVDFYDNVKVKGEKNLQLEDGLKIKKKTYSHVRYNVIENKILMLEEKSDTPDIEIPDPDNEKSEEN
jgi:lipopolysaccharide export system protein LptA